MSDNQKEIYLMLTEMSDKNIDRFYSLIELELVIITLYASLAVYRIQGINEYLRGFSSLKLDILANLNDFYLAICIMTLVFSFHYSLGHLINIDMQKINMLKCENGLYQLKNDQELSKLIKGLLSEILVQKNNFIGSLYLIVLSLTSAVVYLQPNKSYSYQVVSIVVLIILFFYFRKTYFVDVSK